jgi:hypothetical protein
MMHIAQGLRVSYLEHLGASLRRRHLACCRCGCIWLDALVMEELLLVLLLHDFSVEIYVDLVGHFLESELNHDITVELARVDKVVDVVLQPLHELKCGVDKNEKVNSKLYHQAFRIT